MDYNKSQMQPSGSGKLKDRQRRACEFFMSLKLYSLRDLERSYIFPRGPLETYH